MFLVFLLLLAFSSALPEDGKQRIVCYFGSWSSLQPDHINPFACTHLIYAFADIQNNSGIIPADEKVDIDKGGYSRFVALKKKNPELKVIIGVGGIQEGPIKFSRITATRELRATFIESIIKFLRQHGFDGIDLDWQFPALREGGFPYDIHSYANLTKELRSSFDEEANLSRKERLLLTMVIPNVPEYLTSGYKLDEHSKYVDFMNFLGYDFHWSDEEVTSHHAPLYSLPFDLLPDNNIDSAINLILSKGVPPEKLNLGIPAYGRTYNLANERVHGFNSPSRGEGIGSQPGASSYSQICLMLTQEKNWTLERPFPEKAGPYIYKGKTWIAFDDPIMVETKAKYAKEKSLGGLMFWSVDHMDYDAKCGEHAYPLIRAARKVFGLNLNKLMM